MQIQWYNLEFIIKSGIIKHVNVSGKIIVYMQKRLQLESQHMHFREQQPLKHIVDGSELVCDEIIYVMDVVSTIVTSTNSRNSDDKIK